MSPRTWAVPIWTTTICDGQPATLSLAVTGTGTITGTLSPGAIAFSGTAPTITVTVNPTSTTTYTVAGLSDGGCAAQPGDRSGEPTAELQSHPDLVLRLLPEKKKGQPATLSFGVEGTGA